MLIKLIIKLHIKSESKMNQIIYSLLDTLSIFSIFSKNYYVLYTVPYKNI